MNNAYRIALENAARDPDGQVYPWRDLYPLAGQTVVWDGQLWNVLGKTNHNEMLTLIGADHDSAAFVTRSECRPVGWTLADEFHLQPCN